MTDCLEINIELVSQLESEYEIVLALLADLGFNGFRQEEGSILAYIEPDVFSSGDFNSFLEQFSDKIKSYKISHIPDRNWNKVWEQSCSPVKISDNCLVRAPFHYPPKEGIDYDLVISPKMSFGTAHHETTRLMLEGILGREWKGKKLLDLGCGTGILAILAAKMGAEVLAMDNDPLACRNARENIDLNKCLNVRVVEGELDSIMDYDFHTILANINLNVLLQEMKSLSSRLLANGFVILSGFYKKDLQQINGAACENGLTLIGDKSLNRWTVAVYKKAD